jgi:hypothetical protein
MKPLLAISCFVLIVLSTAFVVHADIPKPKASQKSENTTIFSSLEIVPDPKANNAKLQIHQSDLKALRAALDGQSTNTTLATSISHSGPQDNRGWSLALPISVIRRRLVGSYFQIWRDSQSRSKDCGSVARHGGNPWRSGNHHAR